MIRFESIKHQNNHPEEHPILHFDYLKITCDKGKKFYTRKNVCIFGRSKINTRFHEIIVNFSAATENALRKKVYDITSTYILHTDHHWLFERNIYTHFQYITTFNNNMRCEKLKTREREKLFLARRTKYWV